MAPQRRQSGPVAIERRFRQLVVLAVVLLVMDGVDWWVYGDKGAPWLAVLAAAIAAAATVLRYLYRRAERAAEKDKTGER
jgi:hypothetical protein